jgi:hypothetical protein
MQTSIHTWRSRRVLSALPAVAAALLLLASPAAAWGSRVQISGYMDSTLPENEQMVVAGGNLHFFYNNEDGPTYTRTTLDLQPLSGESLMKLTGSMGDAEGIAADGDLMAVVFRHYSTERKTLEIRIGHNGGQSWTDPIRIAAYTSNHWMGNASVAVTGQTVLVAWTDNRNGHVYLRRSVDGGQSFGGTKRLGTTAAWNIYGILEGQVHMAASGSRVVATWYKSRGNGIYPTNLVINRSSDGGATFSPPQTLDTGLQHFLGPSIAVGGDIVLILNATKPGKVRVLRSANGGRTFTGKTLSGDTRTQDHAAIAIDPVNPSSARAVWFAGGRIHLRRSDNGGATWAPREDTLIRADQAFVLSPNVVVTGSRTVIGWEQNVDGGDFGDPYGAVFARADG